MSLYSMRTNLNLKNLPITRRFADEMNQAHDSPLSLVYPPPQSKRWTMNETSLAQEMF